MQRERELAYFGVASCRRYDALFAWGQCDRGSRRPSLESAAVLCGFFLLAVTNLNPDHKRREERTASRTSGSPGHYTAEALVEPQRVRMALRVRPLPHCSHFAPHTTVDAIIASWEERRRLPTMKLILVGERQLPNQAQAV